MIRHYDKAAVGFLAFVAISIVLLAVLSFIHRSKTDEQKMHQNVKTVVENIVTSKQFEKQLQDRLKELQSPLLTDEKREEIARQIPFPNSRILPGRVFMSAGCRHTETFVADFRRGESGLVEKNWGVTAVPWSVLPAQDRPGWVRRCSHGGAALGRL